MALGTNSHLHLLMRIVWFLTREHILCVAVCLCKHEVMHMACDRLRLTNIPECHQPTPVVKEMNLSANLLETIEPAALLLYPELKVLDLQLNQLTGILCGAFGFQSKLTELHLGNNRISSLGCKFDPRHQGQISLESPKPSALGSRLSAFHGLGNLVKLRLGGNLLPDLVGKSFAGLNSLKALHLENNRITTLSKEAFQGLDSLIELDLSGNKLTALKPSQLRGLSRMESLRLNGNHLFRIERNTFQHCQQIREINLSDNLLTVVEPLAFHHLSHLNILRLDNNRISSLDPQVFDSDVPLSYVGLSGNPCSRSCGLLSLKHWLESSSDGSRLAVSVFVKRSQPEPMPGHYLGVTEGRALTQSLLPVSVCTHAELRAVEPGAVRFARKARMTKQHVSAGSGQNPPALRRALRSAAALSIGAVTHTLSHVTTLQYPGLPADATRTRPTAVTSTVGRNSLSAAPGSNSTDACAYNQQIVLSLELVTVTSSSVFLKWTVTGNTNPGAYFRVMYDQFDTKSKFSRFVHIRQRMFCNLSDLRPQTPYFLCVESVIEERVCPVASRDLCVGVVTAAEAALGPEPQTVILVFTGINSLAIVAVFALLACMYGLARQTRVQGDGVSLVFAARNRCGSCTMCAVQMSDLNSAANTNSSQTGTYQPNDMDAIDLPPAR